MDLLELAAQRRDWSLGTCEFLEPFFKTNSMMKKVWFNGFLWEFRFPNNPITLSDDDWGVQSPPKRIGHLDSMLPFSGSVSQDP